MARKRKTKKNIEVIEFYEIEVEDWEAYYHFGMAPKNIIEDVYWEISNLILIGRLISPSLKTASKARIEIGGNPQTDDHWQTKPTITSAKAIGWMEIPRGDDQLIFNCSVPTRSLSFITLAAQAGKIKYVSISGTKLKWRQGTISRISLSAHRDDD